MARKSVSPWAPRGVATAIIGGSLFSATIVALFAALMNVGYAAMTFVVGLVLGFAANLVLAASLGLAWHGLATTRGWRGAHAYVLPGLALGLLIPVMLFLLPPMLQGSGFDTSSAIFISFLSGVIGLALGGLTGLFAWLIRRPDRDTPNPPTSPP